MMSMRCIQMLILMLTLSQTGCWFGSTEATVYLDREVSETPPEEIGKDALYDPLNANTWSQVAIAGRVFDSFAKKSLSTKGVDMDLATYRRSLQIVSDEASFSLRVKVRTGDREKEQKIIEALCESLNAYHRQQRDHVMSVADIEKHFQGERRQESLRRRELIMQRIEREKLNPRFLVLRVEKN